MKNFIKKIWRRKISSALVVGIVITIFYFLYTSFFASADPVRYVTAKAQKGSIIISVSGTGQVSASSQVDIKSKASGDIVFIGVKNGQGVRAGALIAQLDAKNARKSLRDAATNLESAKLALEKLKKPADSLSLIQQENSLAAAKDNLKKLKLSQETNYQKKLESLQNAQNTLKKSYEDGFNRISQAFLDLPTIMSGLEDMFLENTLDLSQSNIDWYANQVAHWDPKAAQYKAGLYESLSQSRKKYNKNSESYKASGRSSEEKTVESLILETYDTAKIMSDAIKTGGNYIDFVKDLTGQHDIKIPSTVATHKLSIESFTDKINSNLLNLLAIRETIEDSKESIVNAQRDLKEMDQNNPLDTGSAEKLIQEREASLAKLKAGPDIFDIKSSELNLLERQNSLLDAREQFADYFIRAPYDGMIAKINVKNHDSISSQTIIATIITKQRIAEIALNEVDVAKISASQKATVVFDAIPDLTLTGEVAELDAIGEVSQGVVTYNAKIAFDTQDPRVRPGMSVSANILIDAKNDVIMAPNSAVKSQGNSNFVEVADGQESSAQSGFDTAGVVFSKPPRRQIVETGLSNDEFTEIISGIKENDIVVTGTINPQAQANRTQQQQSGTFRIPGAPGGGRGGFNR